MTIDTIAAHELALYIINENRAPGFTYEDRLKIARRPYGATLATSWANQGDSYARRYIHEFDAPAANVYDTFSPATILAAAAEVADYYAEHIKEFAA